MKRYVLAAVVLVGLFDGATLAGPVQRVVCHLRERQQVRHERRQQVVQHVQQAAPVRTLVSGVAEAAGDTVQAVGRLVLPPRAGTCADGVCR